MTTSTSNQLAASESLSDDMMEGVDCIAAYTRKTRRQIYYLLETRQLPAFKIGRIWHMRRSTLHRYIEGLESAARVSMKHRPE
jgi:excisionase family DNA binding protein